MALDTAARVTAWQSPEERAARGRAARTAAPRSSHGVFEPPPDRTDPVTLIERQSESRLPDLVPIRYGRMSESPFRFYRGAAAIMAADLAHTPATGIRAQLCGDAHMLNFRLLASPERTLMFDINDFDETLPGPWEWDVKRLAASLVIASRENGFTAKEAHRIVRAAARSYRERMRGFAGMHNLDVWYTMADADKIRELATTHLRKRGRRQVRAALAKARSRDNLQAFGKLTEQVGGEARFKASPPLVTPLADLLPPEDHHRLQGQLHDLITRYSLSLNSDRQHLLGQFRVADMARKVVGVGSVGTRCWIILLLGRDADDPLILQAKEADVSVLAEHCGDNTYATEGQRVVAGQRLMQAASDIFLGWERIDGIDGRRRDFYVRQLRDWKGIAEPQFMEPRGMTAFAELCGATLARAHARSGDRIAIAAYLGRSDVFDEAIVRFADAYADQNERDHAALLKAVQSGRIQAEEA